MPDSVDMLTTPLAFTISTLVMGAVIVMLVLRRRREAVPQAVLSWIEKEALRHDIPSAQLAADIIGIVDFQEVGKTRIRRCYSGNGYVLFELLAGRRPGARRWNQSAHLWIVAVPLPKAHPPAGMRATDREFTLIELTALTTLASVHPSTPHVAFGHHEVHLEGLFAPAGVTLLRTGHHLFIDVPPGQLDLAIHVIGGNPAAKTTT